MLCNTVYALLVDGMSWEQREAFDAELYAPAGGWDAAEARLFGAIDEAEG